MAIKFYTVATHSTEGYQRLVQSADYYNIELNVLGEGATWIGQGQKVNLFKSQLENLADDDVVVFTDGFDVIYLTNTEEILEKFNNFSEKVVFSAESVCHPDPSLAPLFPKEAENATNYQYLNAGGYIGEVGELKNIMSTAIQDTDSDQLYFQNKFLDSNENYSIALDYFNSIFECKEPGNTKILDNQTLQQNNERVFIRHWPSGVYWPLRSGDWVDSYPCIRHGND